MKRTALLFTMLLCCATSASSDTSKRPKILGISSVSIVATHMPESLSYYYKVLNASQQPCDWCERMPGGAFFLGPNQMLRLDPSPPVPAHDNLILGITFKTNSVRDLRRYLVEQKIPINKHESANRFPDNLLSLNDPEGHYIAFVEDQLQPPISTTAGQPRAFPVSNMHIIHAGFIVRERAATEHFYKDILGFRPYWHGGMKDDQTDWVSMQVPDGTDWLEFMVNVEPNADQRLRGIMNHIAIGVSDIHATQKKLIEARAKLTEEPQIGRDGKWQLNLYDPDFTRVEFMEFTPVQKPCCSEFTGPHPGPQSPSKVPANP